MKQPVAPVVPPPRTVAGPPVALPDGGVHHTERLAWAAWRPDGAYRACGRRTDDFLHAGRLTQCLTVEKMGDAAVAAPAVGEGFVPPFAHDESKVDAAPGSCRVLLDDASGDPAAPAAVATLYSPSGPTLLDRWLAPNTVNGDYLAVETSFSPDGKWLAVVHSAVGLGDGERSVDVISVELRPAPICK